MKKIAPILFYLFTGHLCVSQALEELSPAERKQQTVVTEPITLYKGFSRAGLASQYNVVDKVFQNSKKQSIEGNIWGSAFSFSLYGQYGISDRLMVEVLVPYIQDAIYQSVMFELPMDPDTEYLYPKQWKTEASGLGDVSLTLAYQLFPATPSRPALAAFITATLPTGEKNIIDNNDNDFNTYYRPTGEGEFAVNTALKLRQVRYPFSYTVSAAYKYRTESSKVVAVNEQEVKYRNGNLLNISASLHYRLNDRIAFKNIVDLYRFETDSRNGAKAGENGWLLQYLPGISFQLKKLRLDQGVMIPVKGNHIAADPGYLLVVQYVF